MNAALPYALIGALLLFACTAAQPATPESVPHTPAAPSSSSSPRALSERANFSDIVAAAQTATPSKAPGCLLAGPSSDGGWYAGAGFASPLKPLPRPSSDLFTQVMREADAVLLLTQHGVLGSRGMTFVALSEVPSEPGEPAQILIITPSGIFVRSTDRQSKQAPVPLDQAQSLIQGDELRDLPLYLTADAETPIQVVAHILELASRPRRHRVGFALALPEGTRLPEAPTVQPSPFACQSEPEVEHEGVLDPEVIRTSLAPLSAAAQSCFDMLPYQEQQHGTAQLRVVVGAQGRVQQACLEDQRSRTSAALDHCLVDQAKRLQFPKPSPSGEVVFVAPFRFTPTPLPQTLPLCPASSVQP